MPQKGLHHVTPPNRIPWPPIIFLGCTAGALALGWLLPLSLWQPGRFMTAVGWVAVAGGLGLDGAAMLTMRRHQANILPHRAATALVTTGPFRRSRNPIYLGNVIILASGALALHDAWFFLAASAAAAALTKLAIEREEAHMAGLFSNDWTEYTTRTARWLGTPRPPKGSVPARH